MSGRGMTAAEADEMCEMVLALVTELRADQIRGRTFYVDHPRNLGGRPHIHTCTRCTARWDEWLSTGKPHGCHSGYPQARHARMGEPGTADTAPALTIAPSEEPMMPEEYAAR